MKLTKCTLEQVNKGELKSGTKNGKSWSFTPVSLKIKGTWYNNAIFNKDDLENFETGKEIDLLLFEEEYTNKDGEKKMGKKFKLPSKTDVQELRIQTLEERFNTLLKKLVDKKII